MEESSDKSKPEKPIEEKKEEGKATEQSKEQKDEENKSKTVPVEIKEKKWYKDPRFLIPTILTIIEFVGLLVLGISNYNLSTSNYNLQNELALISKPVILPSGIQVKGNSTNIDLPIFITNPSKDTDYFLDFLNSKCQPNTNLIEKHQKLETTVPVPINIPDIFGNQSVIIKEEQPQTTFPLPATKTVKIYCPGFDIENPEENIKTSMSVCIKVKRINDLICEDIPIFIFKI